MIADGTKPYRDTGGRQHEKRFKRRVDDQSWLDEQASPIVTQIWTAPERGRVTVEAWAQQWIAAHTGLKPSTLYRYGSPLRAQILPHWGRHRPADMTHADVAAWVALLVSGGLAPASVRQAHRVLALILSLAVRDGRRASSSSCWKRSMRASSSPSFAMSTPWTRRRDSQRWFAGLARMLADSVVAALPLVCADALPHGGSVPE